MESGEDYANPRNLASGSLTLKDPEEVKARHIQWIPFTLVHTDEDIISWGERMAFLEKNGMTVTLRREMGTDIMAACGQLRRGLQEKKLT